MKNLWWKKPDKKLLITEKLILMTRLLWTKKLRRLWWKWEKTKWRVLPRKKTNKKSKTIFYMENTEK